MPTSITRPQPDEIPDFFKGYVNEIASEPEGLAALERQRPAIEALARATDHASHRYAEGKWTVREVIGHMIDAERVFAYRLLRIARGDRTPLAAFDENRYAATSNADRRELADLVKEFMLVRESTLALVRSLDEGMLANRGEVRAGPITARAQVFVTAGHAAHHLNILKERYGLALGASS
jgi:hypothetical protein